MVTIKSILQLADDDLNYGGIYYTVLPIKSSEVAPVLEKEEKTDRRIIVNINGQGSIHSGLMPDGKGHFFITISKEVRKKYDLEEGDEVTLEISPDNSEYGMPLPEELAELWALDEEAYDVFHTLTSGKQRGLIYVIAKPKRSETRIKKAIQIMDYLKSVNGKLDYRELNAYMKSTNNLY